MRRRPNGKWSIAPEKKGKPQENVRKSYQTEVPLTRDYVGAPGFVGTAGREATDGFAGPVGRGTTVGFGAAGRGVTFGFIGAAGRGAAFGFVGATIGMGTEVGAEREAWLTAAWSCLNDSP